MVFIEADKNNSGHSYPIVCKLKEFLRKSVFTLTLVNAGKIHFSKSASLDLFSDLALNFEHPL